MCKASMALHCQGAFRMPYAMSRIGTTALQLAHVDLRLGLFFLLSLFILPF